MAGWARQGTLKGERGPQGPAGEPDYSVVFPVGALYENSSGADPSEIFGGTWEQRPSLGAFTWERTA